MVTNKMLKNEKDKTTNNKKKQSFILNFKGINNALTGHTYSYTL